jgi:exodeoxyribonuclease VII large subunit
MNQHLSLLELNQLIKKTLDANLEPAYWVVGEIADLRLNQRGHCYFELIEKEEENVTARIRSTIWAYTYRSLSAWFESQSGQPLKNGLKVLCQVTVNFHEIYGISLNVRDIDPRFTLGERARKRLEIIQRLKNEGVFDMNKLHDLPLLPRKIAIISSASAAGYGDFMNQLNGNEWGYAFSTRLFNAVMQGENAPASIMQALDTIHQGQEIFDLVLILRGGGAQVDLDCFDSYDLANYVAQFPIPVLTGIGHERDETITDLVAHTMVKTPTAAAEFIISGVRSFEERLIDTFQQLVGVASQKLQLSKNKLTNLEHGLRTGVQSQIYLMEKDLSARQSRLAMQTVLRLKEAHGKLDMLDNTLQNINPKNVLKRGYSLTFSNGKAVSGEEISPGDQLETQTSTHTLYSTVKEIHSNE